MPPTFGQTVSDAARSIAHNTTASVVDRLTGITSAHEPIIADHQEEAEAIACLVAIGNTTSEVTAGVLMMAAGVILTVVPRKVLELKTAEVTYIDKAAPDNAPLTRTTVTSTPTLAAGGGNLLRFVRESETKDLATGEMIDVPNANIDAARLSRPRLPGVDKAVPTMNFATRQEAVAMTNATTRIGGVGLFTAGLSTTLSGAYHALSGTTTLLAHGAQKAANLIRRPGTK